MDIQFTKMEGAGNDYIYLDGFRQPNLPSPETLTQNRSWLKRLCDRHFGVGSDGLVFILPSSVADAQMRMFNPDGSESEMCGNAIRCVAKYVVDHQICQRSPLSRSPLQIETKAGILSLVPEFQGEKVQRVRVDMGEPILIPNDVPTTLRSPSDDETAAALDVSLSIPCPEGVSEQELGVAKNAAEASGAADFLTFNVCCVSMGNPHCVTFVDRICDAWVLRVGPQIEKDPHFPRRVNAEFVEVLSPTQLKMRVWERGTGETLACGTGACAVAVAAMASGRTQRRVCIQLIGGELEIEWAPNNHVLMTGPAREVFSGTLSFEESPTCELATARPINQRVVKQI